MSEIQMKAEIPTELPLKKSGRKLPVGLVVGMIYALLVLLMWGPLGWKQGMPGETVLVYTSQTSGFFQGFWWPWAGMRIYVSFFFHAAYVLAELLGIKGSFLTYQLVYVALIWGRAFLAFLILRRVLKRWTFLCFLVGALVLTHGADTAWNWVGNINTQGMILWMMLSFYLLVRSLDSKWLTMGIIWLAMSMLACYLGLWTYESELFIVYVVPLLLLLRYKFSHRALSTALIYWIIPGVYTYQTAKLYLSQKAAGSYQEQILRHGAGFSAVLYDFWRDMAHGLGFWIWPQQSVSAMEAVPFFSRVALLSLSLAMIGVVAVGAVWIWRITRHEDSKFPPARTLLVVLGVGLLLLALSFPAFLLIPFTLWRTQFLASIGAGMTMACIIGLLTIPLRRRPALRLGVVMILSSAVCVYGVRAAYQCSVFRYKDWERHRVAIAEILQLAPRVEPGTIIIMTGVPEENSPFSHNMWYDMALRLAYPGRKVAGQFYYKDGTVAPGATLTFTDGEWTYDGKGWPVPLVKKGSLANTIFIHYDPSGQGRLLKNAPAFVSSDSSGVRTYSSKRLIIDGPPSDMGRRRYLR